PQRWRAAVFWGSKKPCPKPGKPGNQEDLLGLKLSQQRAVEGGTGGSAGFIMWASCEQAN
ncbi:MAG: hypothetical protein M3Y54_10370, partial [Bacteroidota bacterium]|nr:hypothetical protein [Bacteroidota bacterium]